MAPLTSERIMMENGNRDPSSITSLKLTLRALSDVSCLRDFTNLEKLDLSCNNISNPEGLGACVNLKWLSVAQNKLGSLKGIEGLSKLTVLNAGQNMVQSMEEVRSLTNLRALILNDNKISSICMLDPLKYLNTLVLSRNPISEIGKSLVNMKSITKLSLSNCQILEIGSALVSCVELKEARFAHNDISSIPDCIAQNSKLQLLDLGKNAISRWSDIKVLSALHNLKNFNLQGNPIAEKDKLLKKVKKLLPNLHIFNAKPIEKVMRANRFPEENVSSNKDDSFLPEAAALEAKKGAKRKKMKSGFGNNDTLSAAVKNKSKNENIKNAVDAADKLIPSIVGNNKSPFNSADIKARKEENEQNLKKSKGKESNDFGSILNSASDTVDVDAKKEGKSRKSKKQKGNKTKEFDDGETSFVDLIVSDNIPEESEKKHGGHAAGMDEKTLEGLVINPAKKNKKKTKRLTTGRAALEIMPPAAEIGSGGPSAWDD